MHATARRLLVATDDGEWAVPGALTAWHAWETVRGRFPALAASPWVLPALRRGPGLDSQIGGRLSSQALQVTFTKHARRTAQHLRATAPPSRREAVEELARGLPGAVLRLLPPARPGRRRAARLAARRRPGEPRAGPQRAPRRLTAATACSARPPADQQQRPGAEQDQAGQQQGDRRTEAVAGQPEHEHRQRQGGRGRQGPPAGAHVAGQAADDEQDQDGDADPSSGCVP